MNKLKALSERMRETRSKFADARHGGIVLSSEDTEAFVERLDAWIDHVKALEIALASLRPIDPAELTKIVPPASAAILHMMRPGTNVVPFPRSPHDA